MLRAPSTRNLNQAEFERLREDIAARMAARRGRRLDPAFASLIPEEVGLQLTNRCNLRCDQCFQWNDSGHHRLLPVIDRQRDMPIEIIEAIFAATAQQRSTIYLWGGEPLIYRDWDRLSELLVADPRWTVLCTNGLGIEERLSSLLAISANLVSLVSLDGLEQDNDALRGRGVFRRVMRGVDRLLEHQQRGAYRGEVSISAVISDALVTRLVELVEFFDAQGINTLYLVLPWFITPATAERMDAVFRERFAWMAKPQVAPSSWHSYTFHLDPGKLDALRAAIQEIASRTWRIRVRYQPSLDPDELERFIRGDEAPAQGRTRCTSIGARMSVLPDGRVTTCKLFPEFSYAKLGATADSVLDAWRSDEARRVRGELGHGLLPICSKCVQLYLHGS
jgi:sulfatase maturation enzyme AslB (radical SAM superfamily)